MANRPENWVFLGDSITEGVGSLRATYVSELVNRMRASSSERAIHDMRLRDVEHGFNRFIRVNVAGYLRKDDREGLPSLWVWNLASEGRTIEHDRQWLPLIDNLRPQRVFIHRGSLESILRPACYRNGEWPLWVPASWRGLVAMDPRCYFSNTPLRRLKQSAIDAVKQRARLRLLRAGAARPLLDSGEVVSHYGALLQSLRAMGAAVTVLGLLPPDERTFPGSSRHFLQLNGELQAIAAQHGADFLDWHAGFKARGSSFYRDGFHPNPEGVAHLAEILHTRLGEQGAV